MGLIQCRGQYNADTSYVLPSICVCKCVYMFLWYFYFFPILLSMNCHSDYNTIDGRIAGNRRPYPDIFSKVHIISQSA